MTRYQLIGDIERRIRLHRPRSKQLDTLRQLTLLQLKRELRHEKRKASPLYPLFAMLGVWH